MPAELSPFEGFFEAEYTHPATEPTDVTLGGYPGRSLEWSVPVDWVVTGDDEFEGCDVEPSSGLRDFVSWFGNGEGERYQQVAGQVDMLWVLDVDGQRLVVDATYSPGTRRRPRRVDWHRGDASIHRSRRVATPDIRAVRRLGRVTSQHHDEAHPGCYGPSKGYQRSEAGGWSVEEMAWRLRVSIREYRGA